MGNKFFVGGGSSTNWNATSPTNWSTVDGGPNDAALPVAGDYVYFKSAADCNVNINPPNLIGWDMTGYTGTISAGSRIINIRPIANINFVLDGDPSSVIRQARFDFGGSNTVDINIYQLGGENLKTGFVYSNSNAAYILQTNIFGYDYWSFSSGTLDVNNKEVTFEARTNILSRNNFGGQTYHVFRFVYSTTGYVGATGTGTFDELYISNSTSVSSTSFIGQPFGSGTLIIKDTLKLFSGTTDPLRRPLIFRGAVFDITDATTVEVDDAFIGDVEFIADGDLDLSAFRVGEIGNNTITAPHSIIFPAGATQTWTNTGTGTLEWWDPANWSGRVPLPQDDATIATAHGGNVTFDFRVTLGCRTLDMSGVTSTGTIRVQGGSMTGYLGGDLIGKPEITTPSFSGSAGSHLFSFTLFSGASQEVSGFEELNIRFAFHNGSTLNLLNSITGLWTWSLNRGFLNLNGNTLSLTGLFRTEIDPSGLTLDGGVLQLGLVGSPTAIFNVRSENFTMDDDIAGEIQVNTEATASSRDFGSTSGSGISFGTVTIEGGNVLMRQGHSYKRLNINNKDSAYALRFYRDLTQNIASIASNGEAGSLTNIESNTSSAATLNYTGAGKVSLDYIDAKYITGTPVNTWYVGTNSNDGGNNTNLIFGDPPSVGTILGVAQADVGTVLGVAAADIGTVLGVDWS